MNASCFRLRGAVAVVAVALSASARAGAPAGRYTYPGTNVTAYDTKTKLTWQRPAGAAMTWALARTYCAGLSLDGTGWRLPTVRELQTIVDFSQATAPMIDPTAFPATSPAPFWSLTQPATSASAAWVVHFGTGIASSVDTTSTNAVRCVR